MKSQTLAVSVVLLLMAVATLPGITFSLSSSVTSYNNSITINGGITITSGDGFYISNVDESFKNIPNLDGAYEITSEDGSFCSKPGKDEKVKLTIPSGKSFKICIKIDGENGDWTSKKSKFDLTIDYTGNDNADISATQLDGGRLDAVEGIKTGYLYKGKNLLGWDQWQLIGNADSAEMITSSSKNITVDITGYENSDVRIHFYIIFLQNQKAET